MPTVGAQLRLKPRVGRIIEFFVGFFLVILFPSAVGWGLALFAPPQYIFDVSAFDDGWLGTRTRGALSLTTRRFANHDVAREAVSKAMEGIPTSMSENTGDVRRYRRADNGRSGTFLVLDTVVAQVEGPDAESVKAGVEAIPFVRRNPAPLSHALETAFDHLGWVLAGIGVYMVFAFVVMGRGGAWAARIDGAPGVEPVAAEALRAQLLAVNQLDVPMQVRETKRGDLIAEWRIADARWTSLLEQGGLSIAHRVTMRIDPASRVIRTIDSSRSVRWSRGVAGLGWSFSFFRGISFAGFESAAEYGLLYTPDGWGLGEKYRYSYTLNELKQPLVKAVVSSGWTWQPVITFVRLVGG